MRVRRGLSPDPAEAERWLREELAQSRYRPSPIERVRDLLDRLLDRLSESAVGLTGFGLVLALVLFLLTALGVLLLASRLRPARRGRSASRPVLDPGAPESAATHRSRARAALAAGDSAAAVREAIRALARSLTERGLAEVRPGATARDVGDLAIGVFPEDAERLHRAITAFDRAAYGGWQPEERVAREVVGLEEELRHREAATSDAPGSLAVPR